MSRVAMVWDGDSFPKLVTDDPEILVFNIDEAYPNDRVFLMGPAVKRVTPAEFDELIGKEIHQLGDKPIVEQAIRAMLDLKPNGKPALSLVEKAP